MPHRSRTLFYFAVFVAAILVIVSVDLVIHKRFAQKNQIAKAKLDQTDVAQMIKVDRQTQQPRPVASPAAIAPTVATDAEKKVSPEFIGQFREETAQIGKPQSEIEVETRLQSLARHLTTDEIDYLGEVINDKQKTGDERALAVELLGRNQSKTSLTELKDFVLSKENSGGDSRARHDEEVTLKVIAVEGIAASSSQTEALSYLSEIQKQSDQSFVKDRVQRSINSIKGLSAAPEVQDNEALKKIIK